jgi:N-acetylglucosaminyldiphosphoundecaprenol N-acetyl-beta-D-mannosaminyltransferase
MERRRRFLGCPIDLLTMQETVGIIEAAIVRGRATGHVVVHVVVNVAKLVACRRDAELRADLESADIVGVDGMGIVWGARLYGIAVPERVTGIDLMYALLARCSISGYRPYFLGGRSDVLACAIAALEKQFPGLRIAGYRDGYFAPEQEAEVVEAIRRTGADMLFVAMPSPKKERFNARNARALGVPFIMGVGGSIDVVAGLVRRAPPWLQVAGLEWAYRLVQEPGRLARRYLVSNICFLGLLIFGLPESVWNLSRPIRRGQATDASE